MSILKKILRRIYFEIIWKKNTIDKYLFDGEIIIGKKTRFYQPLKLKNGGEYKNRQKLFFWISIWREI